MRPRRAPAQAAILRPFRLPTLILLRGAPLPGSVVLLSLSVIADDPRVRRQGDALHDAGWKVTAVGLGGGRSPAPRWPVLAIDAAAGAEEGAPLSPTRAAARGFVRGAGLAPVVRVVRRGLGVAAAQASRVAPGIALARYWRNAPYRTMCEAARALPGRLVLANDWNTLPVAATLAAERRGCFAYDTHEFATEEYAHRRGWRLAHQPAVRAIEGAFVRQAAFVSTVSAGIAHEMDRLYALPRPTLVVRNVPRYREIPYRAPGETLRVLYHGILAPNRGLEATIASVRSWRPAISLSLRGPGEAPYVAALRKLAASEGVAERVSFLPPVAATDLVESAAEFDVGIFALPASSPQNVYALPNKLFEYVMAGLALCVTDLPEMAAEVRAHDLGSIVPDATPEAIARGVNALTRERVAEAKWHALDAARSLCWEVESRRLLDACAEAEGRAAAGAA